ncbi:MAG: hypothetical protein WC975_02300 [Phycisphaerae bacterium]
MSRAVEVYHRPLGIFATEKIGPFPLLVFGQITCLADPGLPCPLQVRPDHVRRLFRQIEQSGLRQLPGIGNEVHHTLSQVPPDRQDVIPLMLGVARQNFDCRIVQVGQVEASGRQRPQFVGPQARVHGYPIADGPLRPRHAHEYRPALGRQEKRGARPEPLEKGTRNT